jgi:hypothetical protein
MTVVNVSATSFPQTLDWLHSYLLEVLQLLLSHSQPSQVNKIFFNDTKCVTWIVLLSIKFIGCIILTLPCLSHLFASQHTSIGQLNVELDCVHFLVCSALSRDVVHHQAPRPVLNCSVLYTKMHKFSYHDHHGRLYVTVWTTTARAIWSIFSLHCSDKEKFQSMQNTRITKHVASFLLYQMTSCWENWGITLFSFPFSLLQRFRFWC